jgi:hypothetical protein
MPEFCTELGFGQDKGHGQYVGLRKHISAITRPAVSQIGRVVAIKNTAQKKQAFRHGNAHKNPPSLE